MPDYSSLLGTLGYDASSLQGLFGQYFKDVDPRWSQFLEPSFETAQTALGELPGMRRGLLGQLTSGLQERGVAAGRGLQARRAGAGFAGFGALDVLGRTTRGGLEREMGVGRFRIGEDIAKKRAGVLGTLGGKVGGFLEQLLAAGTEPAGEGDGTTIGDIDLFNTYRDSGGDLGFEDWQEAGRPEAIRGPGGEELSAADSVAFGNYRTQGGPLSYQDWIDAGKPSVVTGRPPRA